MILIFLIVLLLFGAKKVPEFFRSLGKGVNEFRKAKNEWEQDINEVMSQEPLEDHDFSSPSTRATRKTPKNPFLRKGKSKSPNELQMRVIPRQNGLEPQRGQPIDNDFLSLVALEFHTIYRSKSPPVPKLVFILLSRLIRIFEFTRGGNPAMVVTVFPPDRFFSLRTSKRSPLPIRSSTFGFLGLPVFSETPGAASGKPIESRAEKGYRRNFQLPSPVAFHPSFPCSGSSSANAFSGSPSSNHNKAFP